MTAWKLAAAALCLAVCRPTAIARAAGEIVYQIEALAGTGVCLDIINDAKKNQVTAAKCGNYSGQSWSVEPIDLREGYVRLRTRFTGEDKCLDIVNDNAKTKVVMAPCGNYTGQMWAITLAGPDGLSQFRTQFTGRTACLQLFENDRPSRVRMAGCGSSDTQQWRLNLKQ